LGIALKVPVPRDLLAHRRGVIVEKLRDVTRVIERTEPETAIEAGRKRSKNRVGRLWRGAGRDV
jgi:hypothetical protein